MRSLPSENEWLVDVHEFFIRNLSPELREKMESDGYTTHLQSQSKDPFNQIKLIEEACRRALTAEKTLNSQVKMIRDQLQSAHGFFTTASGEQVLFSPAERTLQHYKHDSSTPPAAPNQYSKPVMCWGCGGNDHRWYDRAAKRVVCPNGTNPIFIKNAANARERLRQVRNNRTAQNKKFKSKKHFIEALLASDANITVNTSDAASTAADTTSTLSSTDSKPAFTVNITSSPSKSTNKDEESPKKKVKFGDKVFNFITHVVLHSNNGQELLPISLRP